MQIADTFDYQTLATEPVDRCNLCGGESFATIATRDRSGFPARTVMCQRCSLIFISPRMSAESYSEFYSSGLYRKIVANQRNFTDSEMRADLLRIQRRYADLIVEFLNLEQYRGGTFLDIGGSTGIVADALCRRYGLRGTVLDPAVDELSEAAALGLSCVQGSIETWDGSEQFDVVGIFQSVDHFLDIAGALRKARRLLKPGGTFFCDIVEVRAMMSQHGVVSSLKIDHPFSLTDLTMRAFLSRAGFQVVGDATTEDRKKAFYVCAACDDVLPPESAVEQMRGLTGLPHETFFC